MESWKKYLDGLSDGMNIEDIVDLHDSSYNYIVSQLIKGIEIEKEHSSDENIAKKIAMDHLVEDPDYYKKLEKIEN